MSNVCLDHSGLKNRINNLEEANVSQWTEIGKTDDKVNNIMLRLNVVLGGVAVTCVMLCVNLILKAI